MNASSLEHAAIGGIDWASLSSPELARHVGPESVALLPLGAIEQHGAHLPLSTDVDIADGLVAAARTRVARDLELLVLPTVAVGASMEHGDFAGTLSLTPEIAIAHLVEIGASVARAGVRRLVLFNSHGGNKAVVDLAALKLRERHGLLVVKANYFRFAPPDDALPAEELRHGLHGGALETAMMMHLAPHKVRQAELDEAVSLGAHQERAGRTLLPEGDAGFAWMAQDLHPSGVVGNATLATPILGKRLVAHFAGRLANVIEEARCFDLAQLREHGP
ncbi:creatininase family protein [Chromohalobacter salexigens]|uniref:Creatininase family protein n=1 Tax=Chromohalobacter moromii TaxID=2860329 RepID=A0A9X2X0D4_9GAMM|nr:creatininase family protein [Chromohalobacter moromii]MCK2044645.1 creatininase family protein [Chromohalobacter moromii]MCT8504201.1 creatininase family protein [Chromohalobacter moromii]NWO10917.1 creatininase family protein [Chromohalobacter salexigens]